MDDIDVNEIEELCTLIMDKDSPLHQMKNLENK